MLFHWPKLDFLTDLYKYWPLQRALAENNGVSFGGAGWRRGPMRRQVDKYDADRAAACDLQLGQPGRQQSTTR